MAEIRIHRPFFYVGCARKLKVMIDGEKVGGVGSGKTEVFQVSESPHWVQVSMDWCTSEAIQVDPTLGDGAEVKVEFASFFESMIYPFVAPSKLFRLSSESQAPPVSPYPRG